MKYVLRPVAREELAAIWSYTAERWGLDQADAYITTIMRRIESATQTPEIGSAVEGLPSDYRKITSGSHRAIYRILGDELIVVRVLHSKQDLPDDIEDF